MKLKQKVSPSKRRYNSFFTHKKRKTKKVGTYKWNWNIISLQKRLKEHYSQQIRQLKQTVELLLRKLTITHEEKFLRAYIAPADFSFLILIGKSKRRMYDFCDVLYIN